MTYFTAEDGTELFYYDWGTGAPVVLIHGWPLTSASWEHQARFLADNGYRAIAYDRRGFGRSGWPATGYDYNTLARDLNSLMEELALEDVTLVGFSMGGGEVARYLAEYGSNRVKKAVLIAAVTPYLLKTADNPEGIEGSVFDDMVEKLSKDRGAFMKEFAQTFYNYSLINHTVSTAQLEFFESMARSASPMATIELVRAWSETDFRQDLKKFTMPTLLIHGTSDAAVPFEKSAKRAVELIPNAQLLEYAGESHGLITTSADKVNEDLIRFLNT